MELMDHAPFQFISEHEPQDRQRFKGFVHRTFSDVDAMFFIESLQGLIKTHGGLEKAFANGETIQERIHNFRSDFFDMDHLKRTEKHVSDPMKGSSAKRLNMFLRWMVRTDKEGVDFGIWKSFSPSELMMPLDVHTASVGRKLGLLKRKQDDWKAVEELTASLKQFDSVDPVKYDLALFGIGVTGSL